MTKSGTFEINRAYEAVSTNLASWSWRRLSMDACPFASILSLRAGSFARRRESARPDVWLRKRGWLGMTPKNCRLPASFIGRNAGPHGSLSDTLFPSSSTPLRENTAPCPTTTRTSLTPILLPVRVMTAPAAIARPLRSRAASRPRPVTRRSQRLKAKALRPMRSPINLWRMSKATATAQRRRMAPAPEAPAPPHRAMGRVRPRLPAPVMIPQVGSRCSRPATTMSPVASCTPVTRMMFPSTTTQ